MLAVDIAGFGYRNDPDLQRCLREALYRIVDNACRIAGVPVAICHCEDRGDGILLIAPPCVPSETLLDALASHVRAGVRQYNKFVSAQAIMRLRMAVHAGHVGFDSKGAYGKALIHLFRLLEAPQVKCAFDAADAEFAVVTSDHLYTEVIQHASGLIDPSVYQPVTIAFKETQTCGWIWLTQPARSRTPAHARQPRGPGRGRSTDQTPNRAVRVRSLSVRSSARFRPRHADDRRPSC